jgi:hypothetical protein
MADPAQTARATALEIPVTVQGSKTVEGSERRELFTETTKTILVSENGAVLQLSAKVLPGQCVFLRNDQSGSEILCRVLESRQAGYTDLEFTSYNPKFWDDHSQQPAPPVAQKPPQGGVEAAVATSALPPAMESGVRTSGGVPVAEEIPVAVLETSPKAPANSSPETTEALSKQPNSSERTDAKDAVPDWDAAKDAELLAVLAAMDRASKPQRESAAKETKKTKDGARDPATANEPQQDKPSSNIASQATGVSTTKPRIRGIRKFTARRDPVSIAIAAAILIAAVLGIGWRAKIESWIYKNNRLSSAQSALPARSTAQQSQLPPSAVATAIGTATATPAQPATPETPKPGVVAVAQIPAAATADVKGAPSSKAIDDPAASAGTKAASSSSLGSSDPAILGHAAHRKPKAANAAEIIPAKIVSQAEPSVPPWAKGLDVDLVVQLNALIDEKGNLVETTPVSGPRLLQPSAQRAVALWVFEPALSNGKPIASHMLLTVQFQK